MKRVTSNRYVRPSLTCQAVTWLMVVLQLCVAVSLMSGAAATPPPGEPTGRDLHFLSPTPIVKGNRTLPSGVAKAAAPVSFSKEPTEQEIVRATMLEQPLVPLGGKPTATDNRRLVRALESYLHRSNSEDVSPLTEFLDRSPTSPWRVGVLVNLGLLHYHSCRFSKAFTAWEEAWSLGKNSTDPNAEILLSRAVGELARMNARVGRMGRLGELLASVEKRPMRGPGAEMVSGARGGLWLMEEHPERAFRCGPMALGRIMSHRNASWRMDECISESRSTTNGFNLQEVLELSQKLRMNLQAAWRRPGADLPLPAVVHWKVGHYAAVIEKHDGRLLIQDPTFGEDLWVTPETLDDEASGYFLIAEEGLPVGWRRIDSTEARTVFGKGNVFQLPPDRTTPYDQEIHPPSSCHGMAVYNAHALVCSLNIKDTPLGYVPPRGPAIDFTFIYHQRGVLSASYSSEWAHNWSASIVDQPNNPSKDVKVYLRGGGVETYTGFSGSTPTNGVSAPEITSRGVLRRTSVSTYVKTMPDGSLEEYGWVAGGDPNRIILLSALQDPQGNRVTLHYDATSRLLAITDSIGQVTTLEYGNTNLPAAITRVTDPFQRSATIAYFGSANTTIWSSSILITDTIGLSSELTFSESSPGFVRALKTPYGTSYFAFGEYRAVRWLEMTDARGETERLEFNPEVQSIPASEPLTPEGFTQYYYHPLNAPEVAYGSMAWRNSYHWDKKAFAEHHGDYTKAKIYHWLHGADSGSVGHLLESEKLPLENRVWYYYPGQTWEAGMNDKMIGMPSKIARVLDDGSTQLYQYAYNAVGNVTKSVDPAGRTTEFLYASNQVDLLEVRQTAGANDLIQRRTYNSLHLPQTVVDGSGRTNRFDYNPFGQILSAANPRNEVTTFGYDTNGYLLTIDGPLSGTNDTTRLTYDGYGRIRTVTDSEGYSLAYDYDNLDRLIRTTFPDATYEQNVYERLDLVEFRDRLGRIHRYSYDGTRHLVAAEDPLHRITRYDWCSCGQLSALVDPMGRTTKWHRDVQGRVTAKEYVDGSQVRYDYEQASSRLKSITDEKGQTKQYDYLIDNNLRQIKYLNAEHATPTVTFSYQGAYNRLESMQDGIGTTSYGYYRASTNGGSLAFVDGPLTNDTVTYDYDELGRVKERSIAGVAQRWSYDPLGRVTTVTNVLGAFTNTYVNASFRPASVFYPNGQRTDYAYYDNVGDQRLQEIKHVGPAQQLYSKFNYAYNPAGQITNWLQQAGVTPPESHRFGYDAADQLLSEAIYVGDTLRKSTLYSYDLAGNRLSETIDGTNRLSSYNSLNQIQTSTGNPAVPERRLEWDAEDRLLAIVQGTNRSEFSYDGFGRRVRIVEMRNSIVVDERWYLWSGLEIREERDSTGSFVANRQFYYGNHRASGPGAGSYFSTRDHLGSVRELIDTEGTIRANYGYDPYGCRNKVGGDIDADRGFTGHYYHSASDMYLALYRAYDASMGRWISRDPLRERTGSNLYSYLANGPVDKVDRYGDRFTIPSGPGGACQSREDLRTYIQEKIREHKTNADRAYWTYHMISTGSGGIPGAGEFPSEEIGKALAKRKGIDPEPEAGDYWITHLDEERQQKLYEEMLVTVDKSPIPPKSTAGQFLITP